MQQAVGLPVPSYTLVRGGVGQRLPGYDLGERGLVCRFRYPVRCIFYSAGPSKRVHQLDNYAGGHFLSADVRYQYSDNFYAGLMHLIGPWYRQSFIWLERALVSFVEFLSLGMQGIYRRAPAELYLLMTTVVLLAWVVI